MSLKEHHRWQVLAKLIQGGMTGSAASRALGLTVRQVRRLAQRARKEGERCVIHGNRGRPSNRRIGKGMRSRICSLYSEDYAEFNLSHFREMLETREKIKGVPCRESLRKILGTAGLWHRRRKAPKHRLRRPRREREGEMLQLDASFHRWFGLDGPEVALVGCIDDATGAVPYAQFHPAETTVAYMALLRHVIEKHGVPMELYTDRDSVFMVNDPQEREKMADRGARAETQFGRALRELGIRWIPAYSPQAKGRVERGWKTHQDRLLNELRLEGIKTIEEGNSYLRRKYLPEHNRRFCRVPSRPELAYRQAPPRADLDAIICSKHVRMIALDHTFTFEGKHYQVLPTPGGHVPARGKVEVRIALSGRIQCWSNRLRLRHKVIIPPLRLLKTIPRPPRDAEADYSRKARLRW